MKSKRLLLLLLMALMVPWAAQAQTSLFSEDFEGGSMPTGWTTDGNGTWSVGTGVGSGYPSTAGQGTYNARITHENTGNATKLITPEIDLSSATSAELSFMHVQIAWAGDVDAVRVYYRTSSDGTWTLLDGQEYTNAVASWTTEEGIALPNLSSTYQIAFEMTDGYGRGVGIDAVSIVQGASCPKPSGLTCTAVTATTTTFGWTVVGIETAWMLEYSTTSDFSGATSVNVTTNPYTLTGLTPEQTYYACVKADCGGGDFSDWSNVCEFKPSAVQTVTIGNGTTTGYYLPVNTYYNYSLTQ